MFLKSEIFLLFLSVWQTICNKNEGRCPPLNSPPRGTVSCFLKNKTVKCVINPTPGYVAHFQCADFYITEGEATLKCQPNGRWNSTPPRCVPDCGRGGSAVSLVVNGVVATPGVFPWHVAIYNFIDNSYEYWCGGSLVSENAVVTAAHCTWKIPPERLMLAFGKFHREFDFYEKNVQKAKAKKIEILESYQDVVGNYNGDLSVIFLDRPVEFNQFTRPICLDWNQQFMDKQLTKGTLGVVVGWGLTENDTFSDVLRVVKLPVTSDEKCIAEQQRDFKKFITYTSFCAGFKNGTGVCNGDSGGGLAFIDKESDRWYLQGLVSVSPRRRGTPFCDPHYYTVFTKVSMFSKWLKAKEIECEMKPSGSDSNSDPKGSFTQWKNPNKDVYKFIRKYFKTNEVDKNGKEFIFPHSKKILHSAGLLNTID